MYSHARFPFKRNRLRCMRCVRCVNENRKKRKTANHGCHCFDRAFLLAGACVCCVKFSAAVSSYSYSALIVSAYYYALLSYSFYCYPHLFYFIVFGQINDDDDEDEI